MDSDGSSYFELRFAPTPRVINTVRRFVQEFFENVLGGGDDCARVALATHELLENSVRHAPSGDISLRVTVYALAQSSLVTILTRNVAAPDQVMKVREILAQLSGSRAAETYANMMNESSMTPIGSGLGLARTRVEAEMDLLCDEEGGQLHVRAQTFVHAVPA